MNKRLVFNVLGWLAMIAAVVMYVVGTNNGHLTELRDYFWVPIPFSIICFFIARAEGSKKQNTENDPPADQQI